jgi:acyl carrier protein
MDSAALPGNATPVAQTVRSIMSRISKVQPEELQGDIHFREELGIDSLMAMEIVATCEIELDISIDEGKLYAIETIGDFESLVLACYRERHGQS